MNLKKFDKADLVPPGKDAKVPGVDLRATISGQVAKDEKLSVFVAVNPYFGDTKGSTFLGPEVAHCEGNNFKSECQFGEEDYGRGEYFAVIAFTAKEDAASEGDQLDITAFSKIATSYSAVLMVQRKK